MTFDPTPHWRDHRRQVSRSRRPERRKHPARHSSTGAFACVVARAPRTLVGLKSEAAPHKLRPLFFACLKERWPSGRRRTLGKRVGGQPSRGFESPPSPFLLEAGQGVAGGLAICPPKYPPRDARGAAWAAFRGWPVPAPPGFRPSAGFLAPITLRPRNSDCDSPQSSTPA